MHKVFVYGSLKRGYGNHPILQDSSFIGETETSDKYRMNSLGGFPGVVKDPQGYIRGELYHVDDQTLDRLDMLEGNGHFYNREEVPLEVGEVAWMYILMEECGNKMPLVDNRYTW